MKLDAVKFGLSAACAAAVTWVFCAILVVGLPGMSRTMGGYMMHGDFSGMSWHIGISGFLAGLLIWAFSAGVFAWLMALIYNKLT